MTINIEILKQLEAEKRQSLERLKKLQKESNDARAEQALLDEIDVFEKKPDNEKSELSIIMEDILLKTKEYELQLIREKIADLQTLDGAHLREFCYTDCRKVNRALALAENCIKYGRYRNLYDLSGKMTYGEILKCDNTGIMTLAALIVICEHYDITLVNEGLPKSKEKILQDTIVNMREKILFRD